MHRHHVAGIAGVAAAAAAPRDESFAIAKVDAAKSNENDDGNETAGNGDGGGGGDSEDAAADVELVSSQRGKRALTLSRV